MTATPGGRQDLLARPPAAPGGGAAQEKVSRGSITLSPENVAAIKEGMLAVTQSGSLAGAFRGLPVPVGAKTGSQQVAGAETSTPRWSASPPTSSPGSPWPWW